MPRTTIVIATGIVLAVSLPAVPAQAGAARTFVSAAGNDNNNCTNVASPCRHFAAAYAATAANGEIYVLDPANYGSLNITGQVSIEGHGWASVAPPGTNGFAILITANPGDKINIVGVVLDGTAITGSIGIFNQSGSSLSVRDSVIRNFGNAGITMTIPSQISVSNTVISDNGVFGINLQALSGTLSCVLDHVLIENNGSEGVSATANGGLINVTISDSVISNNSQGQGILAGGQSQAYVAVRRSTISNNATGVEADSNAIIRLSQSVITGNATGWTTTNGGSVGSSGDNLIDDNPAGNGVPPGPLYK